MGIKKIQIRPKGTGTYDDVLYPETSSDMVVYGTGKVSDKLTSLDTSIATINASLGGKLDSTANASTASKLYFSRTIDGVAFNGSADVSHYAITTTASATAAKLCTLTNFELWAGARISVKFSYANTHTTPTLNVSSTGAKPLKKADGTAFTDIKAGGVYTFIYDGINFIVQGESGVSEDWSNVTSIENLMSRTVPSNLTLYNQVYGTVCESDNLIYMKAEDGIYMTYDFTNQILSDYQDNGYTVPLMAFGRPNIRFGKYYVYFSLSSMKLIFFDDKLEVALEQELSSVSGAYTPTFSISVDGKYLYCITKFSGTKRKILRFNQKDLTHIVMGEITSSFTTANVHVFEDTTQAIEISFSSNNTKMVINSYNYNTGVKLFTKDITLPTTDTSYYFGAFDGNELWFVTEALNDEPMIMRLKVTNSASTTQLIAPTHIGRNSHLWSMANDTFNKFGSMHKWVNRQKKSWFALGMEMDSYSSGFHKGDTTQIYTVGAFYSLHSTFTKRTIAAYTKEPKVGDGLYFIHVSSDGNSLEITKQIFK